jgi:hypothetical protein
MKWLIFYKVNKWTVPSSSLASVYIVLSPIVYLGLRWHLHTQCMYIYNILLWHTHTHPGYQGCSINYPREVVDGTHFLFLGWRGLQNVMSWVWWGCPPPEDNFGNSPHQRRGHLKLESQAGQWMQTACTSQCKMKLEKLITTSMYMCLIRIMSK